MYTMNYIFFLILTTYAMTITGQNLHVSDIQGTWELDWSQGGFFPNDDLIFKKSDASSGQYLFEFKEDFTFVQKLSAEDIGECPVGAFILEKGSWHLQDGKLTLTLVGVKIADYNFEYEMVYRPQMEGEVLKLSLLSISRNIETK